MVRRTRTLVLHVKGGADPLADLLERIGDADINLEGFAVQPCGPGKRIHLLTEDAAKTERVLRDAGFDPETRIAVAAPLTNRPGTLARTTRALRESGIETKAAFLTISPHAPDVEIAVATDDPGAAAKVLEDLESRIDQSG